MPRRNLMLRLQEKYQKEVVPVLAKEFKLKNDLAAAKVEKVVINVGIGEITHDKTALEKAINSLAAITGQRPLICRAKKAIADFKIREGNAIGLKVTLRRKKMYQFLDKLFTLVLPLVRDFQGVKKTAFDNQANYTLGLQEQVIFPEIDYDKIDKVRGMEISIVTSTKNKKQAFRLLELMGMPFEKLKDQNSK